MQFDEVITCLKSYCCSPLLVNKQTNKNQTNALQFELYYPSYFVLCLLSIENLALLNYVQFSLYKSNCISLNARPLEVTLVKELTEILPGPQSLKVQNLRISQNIQVWQTFLTSSYSFFFFYHHTNFFLFVSALQNFLLLPPIY